MIAPDHATKPFETILRERGIHYTSIHAICFVRTELAFVAEREAEGAGRQRWLVN
jgi:hypothetical protein